MAHTTVAPARLDLEVTPEATSVLPPTPAPPATPAPPPADHVAAAPEVRRSTSSVRARDVYALVGSALAALATTALLYQQLLPFDGWQGFIVLGYGCFVAIYAAVLVQDESGPALRDRLMSVLMASAAAALVCALAFIVVYTLFRGVSALRRPNFFVQDMSLAGPLEPLTVGGISHAIVGTLIQISIALAITIPLGLACAVFLNEVRGRFARFVRTIVEAMTALPSIVAGLFIFALAIQLLGFEKSGFAAALAITVMMLPIVIRAADVVLRLVPGNLREASAALGAPQVRTVWHVVLPTARSGLATSVILGTARGIGETSPVLLTAGFTAVMNVDPLHSPMVSLPLATFEMVKSPQPEMISRGFGAAATLLVLVLVLFAVARVIGGRGAGKLTRRQEHRAVRASRQEAARFEALHLARDIAAGRVPPPDPFGETFDQPLRPPTDHDGPNPFVKRTTPHEPDHDHRRDT